MTLPEADKGSRLLGISLPQIKPGLCGEAGRGRGRQGGTQLLQSCMEESFGVINSSWHLPTQSQKPVANMELRPAWER